MSEGLDPLRGYVVAIILSVVGEILLCIALIITGEGLLAIPSVGFSIIGMLSAFVSGTLVEGRNSRGKKR